jgi:predicted glycosyltransferase
MINHLLHPLSMLFTRLRVRGKSSPATPGAAPKIWIDLENTPHIPFFKPIIRELENRGYRVVLTARDAFQTCEMASEYGLTYTRIGRHYGQNRFFKLFGLALRGLQLIPFVLQEKPVLGLNHGARAQILVCNMFGIPNVMMMDYEHTSFLPLMRPSWEIVPEVVAREGLHCKKAERIRKYAGIKEDVYVPEFKPDPSIVTRLQLDGDIVVTVRPPATEAHYHNPEAEVLFKKLMERICSTPGVKAVLLPRNVAQKQTIIAGHPEWFKDAKVIIPDGVVDGLNLLWHSDLAVSGGGTMNREAAALGVPVYSIFRGKSGAVDRSLRAQGRLVMIENAKDVEARILLQRRNKEAVPGHQSRRALREIVNHIDAIHLLHSPGLPLEDK